MEGVFICLSLNALRPSLNLRRKSVFSVLPDYAKSKKEY
jgi:hypothetical protein